ncbi:MAG: ABC transporter permease [Prevotella sp.]|jgi:ABC-type antimicrobial peptide transport system permease subunit|nr:ABC transporter permease [Prevotella sp.]
MLKHYFKIALRNLWKYKVQSVISIIGLAVGFTCFSLSLFWLEYEKSYDNFHSKADRIYSVQYIDSTDVSGYLKVTPYPLAQYMKETYPEVEEATSIRYDGFIANVGVKSEWFIGIAIDSSFSRIFDFPEKSLNYPYYYDDNPKKRIPTAITRSAAKKLLGGESLLDKEIESKYGENTYLIEKIIDDSPLNTNIPFDFIIPATVRNEWNYSMCNTALLLKENASAEELKKKLLEFDEDKLRGNTGITIIPIKDLNIIAPNKSGHVKYNYIRLFALSGLLVAFCALFNYLMLFVNRIRMRSREFALRKVNGASTRSLLALLYSEYFLILMATLILGYAIIYAILPDFKKLSMLTDLPDIRIYVQTFMYLVVFFIVIMLISILPIYYFQHKSLQSTIQKESAHTGKNIFYKICVLMQIIISIGFIFCTTVLAKQVNHFNRIDLGFNRERISLIDLDIARLIDTKPYADRIKQLASVEEVLKHSSTILWGRNKYFATAFEWENKTDQSKFDYEILGISPQFIDFFGMKIVKGRNFDENSFDESEILINETMVKALGWNDPIGKTIKLNGDKWAKVIGVTKDFYVENPELPLHAIIMERNDEFKAFSYKYKEGQKKQTEEAIKHMTKQDYPNNEVSFSYMEDFYENLFKSENALLKLLAVTTITCIIISIFGIYSMVTLICAKRRKEIAIRKVNGARVWDILAGLLKEYITLLVIGAIIIFPVAYKIMATWIEHYTNRTTIDWWIYAVIFTGTLLVVTVAVFMQVWRAANQNPAEILKSE